MRHNMHKQLYTRRTQTPHTKKPSSTHEEPKLHTRRNRSHPTEATFFASKYMFKNSDTRTIYGSQASQRERAPVAYHQATGALLIKYPSSTFGRLFKSNAYGSQVGHRQISTNPQTLAKLPLTAQRKTLKVQKPSHREPMEQSMAHPYILRSTLRSIRRWSHYSAAASSAFLVRRVVRVLRLGFSSSATSIFTPANSGSMRIRPQYSHTMIFLCILISS